MAMNNSGNQRTPKAFTNDSTGVRSDNGPYVGVVMDNRDPTRSGRCDVWLKTHTGGDKNDTALWRTVSYLSPFYGSTPFNFNDKTPNKFDKNGHAYGMWFASPDLGVEVLCFFVDGNPNQGYYVGYVPQIQMNHMIPAIGARDESDKTSTEESALSNAKQLPVIEMSQSTENHNNADFYNVDKPVHSVYAGQLWKQGTLSDNVRGPIGTSVQRESPSYAYGISTPGRPVYAGGFTEANAKDAAAGGEMNKDNTAVEARRGGHSFSMDDGDIEGNDNLMRLRTSTGHQITMSDDGACIYIQHANGDTWMEFGNEGTIDLFATNSLNVRTKGELNFHADNNINFFSGKDINMFAKENIKMEAEKNFDLLGLQQLKVYSEEKVLAKSGGVLNVHSFEGTNIKSDSIVVVDGSTIQLNSYIAPMVEDTESISHTSLADTEIIGPSGWESIPGKLDSIVTRAPTHEPYPHHNESVPVPVTSGAPVTPAAKPPPPQTQSKIDTVKASPPPKKPTQTADVAKQATSTPAVEVGPMDKAAVQSTLTQQANSIEQAVDAVSDLGLGKFGIMPQMLEDLGLMKPGIIDIANTSVGEVFEKLADPAMFTGALGINSLDDLLNSEKLQSSIVQKGMEYTNGVLKQSGILTGLESATDTASMLATSMVAAPADIVNWAKGQGDVALGNIMDEAAKGAQFAVDLVEGPAKEVVDGITKGFPKVSELAKTVGNIDSTAVDAAADALVSNDKIPSAGAINKKVQENIAGTVKSAVNEATNLVDNATDKAKEAITRFT